MSSGRMEHLRFSRENLTAPPPMCAGACGDDTGQGVQVRRPRGWRAIPGREEGGPLGRNERLERRERIGHASAGAKKKPPERTGPRGAKDAIRFRERLDAGPTAHAATTDGNRRPVRPTLRQRSTPKCTQSVPPASMPAGSAPWSAGGLAPTQMRTLPRGSSCCSVRLGPEHGPAQAVVRRGE